MTGEDWGSSAAVPDREIPGTAGAFPLWISIWLPIPIAGTFTPWGKNYSYL